MEKKPRPVHIIAFGSGADELEWNPVGRNSGRVSPKLLSVFVRCKIAAAAPTFVSDAPKRDVVGSLAAETSFRTRLSESCRAFGRIAVFDPLVENLRWQAAKVRGHIRRSSRQLAEFDEFVGTERVRLETRGRGRADFLWINVLPKIGSCRTFRTLADPVSPVVAVGKTTARISDDRCFYPFESINQFFSDTEIVWDLRVFTDPDAVLDDGPKVLDKMAVNIRVDRAYGLFQEDLDLGIRSP